MPQGDSVLIQIITAANLAGINQAQKSFLGLQASTVALAAVLFAILKVGKAADENFKKQASAADDLSQAYASQGRTLADNKQAIDDWLEVNAKYIDDQYAAQHAIALFVRAGNSQVMTMRLINDALDLSAIKHQSLTDSATQLEQVLSGNSKALRIFGITTEEYNAIMGDKTIPLEERQAKLLELIEQKTNKARESTDKQSEAQRQLNKHWEDFTARLGPGVTEVMTDIYTAADTGVQILDLLDQYIVKIGKHSDSIDRINQSLVINASLLRKAADAAADLLKFLDRIGSHGSEMPTGGYNQRGQRG